MTWAGKLVSVGRRLPRRAPRPGAVRVLAAAAAIALAMGMALSGCAIPGGPGMPRLPGMGGFGQPSPQERAQNIEPALTAAGFQTLTPQTSAHRQQLAALPALQLNYYVTKDGRQRYWLADPTYCGCLMVGDAAAYQRYENLEMQNQALESRQQAQMQQQQMMQMQQMQQMQTMGPFGGPMMGPPMIGGPFGVGVGGPGMGVVF